MPVGNEGTERLPPQSREAERSVLGSMLRDNGVIGDVVQIVRAENFYADAHQKIFQGIAALYDKGHPVDVVVLAEELKQRGQIEDIGGYAYLGELWDAAPTAANAEYYARIVRDRGLVRSLIHASTEILRDAYDQVVPADELLEGAERKILEIAQLGMTGQTFTLAEAIQEAYDRIDTRHHGEQTAISGLPTGYVDLDEITAGLQNSELVIIAARPSVGKCLAHDSEILLADGSVTTIEELYRRRSAHLLTLTDRWQLTLTRPSAYVDDGIKPVYRVTTALGRQVETTLCHPFLTTTGWRPLHELRVGDRIAVPRRIAVFGQKRWRESEIELLAASLSGGPFQPDVHPPSRVAAQPCGASFQPVRGRPVGLENLSREQSLGATRARDEKSIPPEVFQLARPQLALFLNRLFAAAGAASLSHEGKARVVYTTAGERLARQVQHILLRFGVVAALRRGHDAWRLEISDGESLETFAAEIGLLGQEECLAGVVEAARQLLPAAGPGHAARGDVCWDEVVAIEPRGLEQVYDLTIGGTHNFVANDICVHNTAFALNMIRNITVDHGHSTFFVSLEQSRIELAERLLCCQARVDSHRLRKGTLSSDDMQRLIEAGGQLRNARLFIDDSPGQGMLRIAANARRLHLREGIKLVVIDYLQLIEPDNRRDPRQEQVAQISRRLKFLARELMIPVIALAQVNRASEDRQDHRPRLADLRESGSIEQDADTVMLLHRPDRYEPGQHEGVVEVIVGKQRNGPTGDVTLQFVKQYMRYENYVVSTPFEA